MNDEQKKSITIDHATFQTAYAGSAPWDIGKPQPAFAALAGTIAGSILDVGCGTGENALFFAEKGHQVTGLDFLPEAIASAKQKAAERALAATFQVADALNLCQWTAQYDNIIDSGLFHVFSDRDRARYVLGLQTVLARGGRLFLLCFSEKTPGTQGPRRVCENDLRDAFRDGWRIDSIEPARFEVRPEPRQTNFAGEDPRAWLLVARFIA